MPSSYQLSVDEHPPLRRRAIALLLTVAAHVLLLLMLLKLAPPLSLKPKPDERLTTFNLPEPKDAPARTRAVAEIKRNGGGRAPRSPEPKTDTAPPPPPPKAPQVLAGLENFDLANVPLAPPRHGTGASEGSGAGGASEGSGSGAGDGAGTGPGGARLYNADWYRHPTNAELDPYLPKQAPRTGWGEVACKTLADHHVEDCEELGESPAGSGFSRAVRQAAWQFLVRPPRLGGNPLVGAWVRIRIDYTETGIASDSRR